MPAYSFQKQFVPMIESGEKTHTIRAQRKNRPKAGQIFYGYYGMRTKQCRKLFESTITRVQEIVIHKWTVRVDGEMLFSDECEALAKRDGFANFGAMMKFWEKTHELPFRGDIIHWKKIVKEGE